MMTDAGGTGGSGGTTDGGLLPFGAPCTMNAQCESNVCFIGGMQSYCSLRCTSGAQCPVPPTSGICNMMGYCRKP
jgi:hypothetical protein